MKQFINRMFNIRSGEWERVLLTFALNLSMGIAFVLLDSATETLFLKKIGPSHFPELQFVTALLRFLSGLVYAAYADRMRNDMIYIYIFLFGSVCLGATWVFLSITSVTLAYGIFYILGQMIFNLSILHFGAYANGLFDILESKRLFPLISTGARFGGIIGGFGLGYALNFFEISQLILTAMGFLVMNIILIYIITWRVGKRDSSARSSIGLRRLSVKESYKQGFNFIKRSSLLMSGAFGALTMVILLEFHNYQYNFIFNNRYNTEDLAAFFGIFFGISNVIGLVMQALLVPRMVKWLGVSKANLVFPLTSLVSSCFLLLNTFPAAVFTRFNHKIIKEAIKRPTTFMVYNPVPLEMRGRAEAFIKGFFLPLGTLISSMTLILAKNHLSLTQIGAISIILSGGYIFWTIKQNTAYVKTLVSLLRQKSVDLHSLAHGEFGRVTEKEMAPLIESLQDKDEHVAVFAAEVLGRVGGSRAIQPILEAMVGKPSSMQSAFIRILGNLEDPAIIEPLTPYLQHKDSRVRADCVEAIGRLHDNRVVDLVKRLIFDPNNRVSANSVIVLASSGNKEMVELGYSVLEEMLISDDSNMRASAIFALGLLAPPDARKRIMKYLRDPADSVRHQACASMQRLVTGPDKELSEELSLLLDDRVRKVRMIAIETLNGIATPEAIEPVKLCLIDHSIKIRRNAIETLVRIGEPAFEALLPQLRSIDISVPLKEQLVIVLRQINLEKARTEFLELAQRELRTAYANCTLIAVLQQCEAKRAVELLIKAIEDKNTEIVSLCLRILESMADSDVIKIIERGLKFLDSRTRANAIETLEHVGDKRIIRQLIPLLDNVSYEERADMALQIWNIKKRTLISVIRHFVGSRDPWLRACALFAIGDMKMRDFGHYVIRNINDIDRYVRESAVEAMEKLGITPETYQQDGQAIQYI